MIFVKLIPYAKADKILECNMLMEWVKTESSVFDISLLSIEGTMSQMEFYILRVYQAIGAY